LEEHDKKSSEILNEIKQLREDFNRLSTRVEVTIESMGRRWGEDLERMVLEIFKEALEKRGIELRKVEKMRMGK
jgi:di/tripeptidase